MTWRTNKFTYFKFSIATLLGLTMLISFAIYFMASRGAVKLEFSDKPVMIKTSTNIITHLDNTTQIEFPLSKVPATIHKQSYNYHLLNSLLAFSIISIPLLFAQLIFGAHDNEILSRKINLLAAFAFVLLLSLMAASLNELVSLSDKMEDSKDKYQKILDSALAIKQKSVKALNDSVTKAKVGDIIKFTWK